MRTRKPRRRTSFQAPWLGIIGTGQSLSVGARAGDTAYAPVVELDTASISFTLKNMIEPGGATTPASTWTLGSLSEPIRGIDHVSTVAWPNNVSYQSPHATMGVGFTEGYGSVPSFGLLHTVAGQNGQGYEGIKKGGTVASYAGSIAETQRFQEIFTALGVKYEVLAVVLTHGESDYGSATYGADILQLLADYDSDVKAITGQTRDVKMILTQPSAGWPRPVGEASNIPDVMLTTYLAHPDRLILMGPKTHLDYVPGDFHLSAEGTTQMGLEYGRVLGKLAKRVPEYHVPFMVNSVLRSGSDVQVTLNRAIVEDGSLYGSNHTTQHTGWANGGGFEVRTSGGAELTITGYTIAGNVVTLHTTGGTPGIVSYTLFGDGVGTIRRGKFRDASDNWLVQFSRTL